MSDKKTSNDVLEQKYPGYFWGDGGFDYAYHFQEVLMKYAALIPGFEIDKDLLAYFLVGSFKANPKVDQIIHELDREVEDLTDETNSYVTEQMTNIFRKKCFSICEDKEDSLMLAFAEVLSEGERIKNEECKDTFEYWLPVAYEKIEDAFKIFKGQRM